MNITIDTILNTSRSNIIKDYGMDAFNHIQSLCQHLKQSSHDDAVKQFTSIYRNFIKSDQSVSKLDEFICNDPQSIKAVWGDCLESMKNIADESIHNIVTSPPYYNARKYSQWDTLDDYMDDMHLILTECYRILGNHRAIVFNIGDVTGNDNMTTYANWGSRKLPLSAYFIQLFEDIGFHFVDSTIWDKGQPQSFRNFNGDTPYPFYQYPINCYEHIMVFFKHRDDSTRYPCPICGSLKVSINGRSQYGILTWECKNEHCMERSPSGRGKRFSTRTVMMESMHDCIIDAELARKWRRDIVKINPVIKINCKGENILGHTAPFPKDIPEFSIGMYSKPGEIILDPFAGSFTSAIVANDMDRIGVGMEQDRSIHSAIIDNIRNHHMELMEYDDGIISKYDMEYVNENLFENTD